MQIKEVLSALERFAPLPLQDGFDNAGLQIGLTDAEVSGALLCLDVTEAVIDEAIRFGCNLVVSHHPLLFRGLKCIGGRDYIERCVMKAIKHDADVETAGYEGEVRGKNGKIEEKLRKEKAGDGLPQMGGKNGGSGAPTRRRSSIFQLAEGAQ